jgi:hypothetical protein
MLQPLKVNVGGELIGAVETAIASNKIEKDADLFKPIMRAVRPDIDAALSDFRQKIAMGECSLYISKLLVNIPCEVRSQRTRAGDVYVCSAYSSFAHRSVSLPDFVDFPNRAFSNCLRSIVK